MIFVPIINKFYSLSSSPPIRLSFRLLFPQVEIMQPWLKISLLLCTFGFLKEIRPSEPFIVDYLAGPWRNLTMEQVQGEGEGAKMRSNKR